MSEDRTLVISGPSAEERPLLLKKLSGLMQAMLRSGMLVPALAEVPDSLQQNIFMALATNLVAEKAILVHSVPHLEVHKEIMRQI